MMGTGVKVHGATAGARSGLAWRSRVRFIY